MPHAPVMTIFSPSLEHGINPHGDITWQFLHDMRPGRHRVDDGHVARAASPSHARNEPETARGACDGGTLRRRPRIVANTGAVAIAIKVTDDYAGSVVSWKTGETPRSACRWIPV